MKTSAERSSRSSSAKASAQVAHPFFPRAGGGDFFAPARPAALQLKLVVNKAGDRFEQEADATAKKVMRIASPASKENPARQAAERLQRAEVGEKLQKKEEEVQKSAPAGEERLQRQGDERLQRAEAGEKLQRKEEEVQNSAPAGEERLQRQAAERLQRVEAGEKLQKKEEELQRKASSPAAVDSAAQSAIMDRASGGQPLAADVRTDMESRFGADFSGVRIHDDQQAARLATELSARAFTYKNNIFFSHNQYRPGTGVGKELLAHELTHTIQQGHAVQRSPQVVATSTQPHVQRSAIDEILDWIADKANNIPGFRMFTIVLGMNPVTMSAVDRSAANILRALIEFMPGGAFITTALDNHGVFNKVATWIEGKIKALGMVGQMFKNALKQFLKSRSLSDLLPWNWGRVWSEAKTIFTAPIGRLFAFAKGVVADILRLVKEAIQRPLVALAQGTRGYELLTAVLGQDPITGEPVARNADTLIGGFMKLIGQEEIWQNLKRGKAVPRAWAWFQGVLAGLLGFIRAIPGKIVSVLKSLTFKDIITVAGAFAKIVGAFADIAGRFMGWAFNQVVSLLEILFSVVAPGVLPYIRKARGAFVTILKNPIAFAGNLVRAGRLGFEMFAANIIGHLKAALIKWLVGPLAEAGVYIPKSFGLLEIIKLVLSVLGLTWANIRKKLVKIIPEPVLVVLERTASILVTLVREGPVAAWTQIKAELTELKDQLISEVTQMVAGEVVKAAVGKLVSMLNPAGAVIQAIIAIYNTITFFIDKAQQIAAVVASFINSIAAGQVAGAAKRVEQTLASTLVVVIAFLAKFTGLGGIPAKLVNIVKKIRKPIDKGLDKIVAWLGRMLKKLASTLRPDKRTPEQQKADLAKALKEAEALQKKPNVTEAAIRKGLPAIKAKYKLQLLELVVESTSDSKEKVHVEGEINPKGKSGSSVVTTEPDGDMQPFKISRPSGFTAETAKILNPDGRDLKLAKLDRRHVISSKDMAEHYETVLVGTRKWSKAKALLVKKKETVATPLSNEAIQASAKGRHYRFFNDLKNLFLGPRGKNRSLGRRVDIGSDLPVPILTEEGLQEHLTYVKKTWALDSTFKPTME
ncbi:MAG: DUF4157 domain-containing protein [Desulfopila sp.]